MVKFNLHVPEKIQHKTSKHRKCLKNLQKTKCLKLCTSWKGA